MTADADIPADVREFVVRSIGSIEHLEVLLLARQHHFDWLTAAAVSTELRSSTMSAEEKLTDLAAHHLLEVSEEAPYRYRYAPEGGLDAIVQALAQAYSDRRFTIINLILSRPLKNIQIFSDAFRLRPDPPKEPHDP